MKERVGEREKEKKRRRGNRPNAMKFSKSCKLVLVCATVRISGE
jgi:hypothetical protein